MVKSLKNVRKATLPLRQLTILAICRFAEPVASTSVYPYIPEMIQSFDVPIDQVAKYTGWLSAVFSLSQCLTAITWGRASDRFGRKYMIILALSCTMCSSIFFGFSSSLTMAFVMRALQGLSNGNVGIIRTAVAEMVPQKELQPRAFSIMPLVWNIGSIFGPSIGGGLVRPTERYPGIFGRFTLLEKYPFALPNIVISILFLTGILSGILFLRETLEDKKNNRDYGLIAGKCLIDPCARRRRGAWSTHSPGNGEADPFLDESSSPLTSRGKALPGPVKAGWKDVFSPQSNVNLAAYTGLAMHSIAFDQVLPVFLHYPPNSDLSGPVQPPFRFEGGFGLESPRIGLLFTVYGFFGMLIQFLVFPPVARKYGVLKCFKACAVTFPLVYLAMPFTSLVSTNGGRQAACLALMLVKCFAGIFAFPCSTILLTNSAASLKILGTLNGVATSISAIGRAAGPALAGAAFSYGVDKGYIIVPFWVLAAVGAISAVPIWWLIEMEGFGARKDDSDDEEEEEALLDSDSEDSADLNARTEALTSGVGGTEEAHLLPENLSIAPLASRPSPRGSFDVVRRATSPLGTGLGIVTTGARRYSSDLGTTRAGMGTGGTSFH